MTDMKLMDMKLTDMKMQDMKMTDMKLEDKIYIVWKCRLHYNAVCNSFQNNGRIQVIAAQ